MTASYSSVLNDFFSLHNTAKDWTTQSITISVATSLDDDTPKDINLADTIGRNKNVPKISNRSDNNCYWLSKSFSQNDDSYRQKVLHPIVVRACHASGFIVHGEYEQQYNCIQFECRDSKYHDEEKRKAWRDSQPRNVKNSSIPPIPRKRKPARPIAVKKEDADDADDADDDDDAAADDDAASAAADAADDVNDDKVGTCPFRFRLYWDKEKRRWFFPHKQRGCVEHCGHLQVAPQFLRMQTRFESQEELEIAENALAYICCSNWQLVCLKNGHTFGHPPAKVPEGEEKE